VFTHSTLIFSLDNFEGPLELLLYLIQKEELDVSAIALKKLTVQFMQAIENAPDVDVSSETLSLAASLLLMKSQKLLPQEDAALEMDEDPRMELIQSLIEYCQFKDAAKTLSLREEEQKGHFPRGTPLFKKELGTGLEAVEFDTLKILFTEMLKRSAQFPKKLIHEDEWQVSHKLSWLKDFLDQKKKVALSDLFQNATSRMELIVLFLALLEMMKLQQAFIVKENEMDYIIQI
jgi:segregation and condensation protein A